MMIPLTSCGDLKKGNNTDTTAVFQCERLFLTSVYSVSAPGCWLMYAYSHLDTSKC